MTDQFGKRDLIPTLEERVQITLASSDTGCVQDRPQLSDRGIAQLRSRLERHLSAEKVDSALGIIQVGFSDAFEAARVERQASIDAEASRDAKKPSSKLGVRLRGRLDDLLQLLEHGGGSHEEICASILAEPELARLVTVHIEESMRPLIADPLERAPSNASELLPEVMRSLRDAIDKGVTLGPVEAAHDILARTVSSALSRDAIGPQINLCVWVKTNGGMGYKKSVHQKKCVYQKSSASARMNSSVSPRTKATNGSQGKERRPRDPDPIASITKSARAVALNRAEILRAAVAAKSTTNARTRGPAVRATKGGLIDP